MARLADVYAARLCRSSSGRGGGSRRLLRRAKAPRVGAMGPCSTGCQHQSTASRVLMLQLSFITHGPRGHAAPGRQAAGPAPDMPRPEAAIRPPCASCLNSGGPSPPGRGSCPAERRRIRRATGVTSAAARVRPSSLPPGSPSRPQAPPRALGPALARRDSAGPGLGKAPQHAPGATARSRARGEAQTGGQPAALQGRRAGTRRGGAGLKRPAESWSMRRRRATWSVTAMRKHARHANSPCPAHHTRHTSPPA